MSPGRPGRRIVVMSNCQLGGLHAALSAMLPDDDVIAVPYHGVEPPELATLLPDADVWVSSYHPTEARPILERLGSRAQLVSVPLLLFTGFHPDIVHVMLPDGRELESAAGGYSSAIVAWGWMHGLDEREILDRFNPATFDALGYTAAWEGGVRLARYVFDEADADFDDWFLPLVARGGMFMLTDNHPRIDALVQLARQVARRLGARPELVAYPWETVVPDGLLATSTVWPLYPHLADRLDHAGAYVWRCVNGELIDLETFVSRSLALYRQVDPATVTVSRFSNDDRIGPALANVVGAVDA
jgi:Polysaccharide biosynthesis enzyme WcbI